MRNAKRNARHNSERNWKRKYPASWIFASPPLARTNQDARNIWWAAPSGNAWPSIFTQPIGCRGRVVSRSHGNNRSGAFLLFAFFMTARQTQTLTQKRLHGKQALVSYVTEKIFLWVWNPICTYIQLLTAPAKCSKHCWSDICAPLWVSTLGVKKFEPHCCFVTHRL